MNESTVDIDPNFFQAVLNAIPDNIAVLDREGVIRYVNDAWLNFANANGAVFDTVSPGADYLAVTRRAAGGAGESAGYAQKALDGIQSVLTGEQTYFTSDYPCHGPSERRWFSLRIKPLRIEGRPYCVTSHINISELRNTQTSLAAALTDAHKANTAKSVFLATMSHELRTPLNSVLGFTGIMTEEVFGPLGNDKYREYLRLIRFSGERLVSLVDDILDLTKVERGEYVFHDEVLDLDHELETFLSCFVPGLIESPNRQVTANVEPNAPMLFADRRAFTQIVENLVTNALKFAGDEAAVIVAWNKTDDGGGRLSVSDNGPGIDAADLDRLTEPFVRAGRRHGADPYIADMTPGIGLGLHIVAQLVKAHDADLNLQSTPGEGTTVTITFPPSRTVPLSRN